MVIFIRVRVRRFFCDRRHRSLRDEFSQHSLLLGRFPTLSTDSHSDSELLLFNDSVELAGSVLRCNHQEPRHSGGRSVQHDANWVLRHRQAQNLGGILGRALGIVHDHPGHFVILQDFASRLPIFTDKEPCALRNAIHTLVGASSYTRLTRPISDLWRKPPLRQKRTPLERLHIQRKLVQLHRFVPLLDPAHVIRFVRPKSRVPIVQNREERYDENRPREHARLERLEQTWQRERENRQKKINPACLPNRQDIGRRKQNNHEDWQRTFATKCKPNENGRGDQQPASPLKPNRMQRRNRDQLADSTRPVFKGRAGIKWPQFREASLNEKRDRQNYQE